MKKFILWFFVFMFAGLSGMEEREEAEQKHDQEPATSVAATVSGGGGEEQKKPATSATARVEFKEFKDKDQDFLALFKDGEDVADFRIKDIATNPNEVLSFFYRFFKFKLNQEASEVEQKNALNEIVGVVRNFLGTRDLSNLKFNRDWQIRDLFTVGIKDEKILALSLKAIKELDLFGVDDEVLLKYALVNGVPDFIPVLSFSNDRFIELINQFLNEKRPHFNLSIEGSIYLLKRLYPQSKNIFVSLIEDGSLTVINRLKIFAMLFRNGLLKQPHREGMQHYLQMHQPESDLYKCFLLIMNMEKELTIDAKNWWWSIQAFFDDKKAAEDKIDYNCFLKKNLEILLQFGKLEYFSFIQKFFTSDMIHEVALYVAKNVGVRGYVVVNWGLVFKILYPDSDNYFISLLGDNELDGLCVFKLFVSLLNFELDATIFGQKRLEELLNELKNFWGTNGTNIHGDDQKAQYQRALFILVSSRIEYSRLSDWHGSSCYDFFRLIEDITFDSVERFLKRQKTVKQKDTSESVFSASVYPQHPMNSGLESNLSDYPEKIAMFKSWLKRNYNWAAVKGQVAARYVNTKMREYAARIGTSNFMLRLKRLFGRPKASAPPPIDPAS